MLVSFGGASPLGGVLRQVLLEKAPDESWTRAIATPPGRWLEFLRDVFAMEMVSSRTHDFLRERDFDPLEGAAERLQREVLLPRERPTNPLAPLFALPPEEAQRVYLVYLLEAFQVLARKEPDPELLRSLCVLTGTFGVMAQLTKGEVKAIAEDSLWRCHALFILGCMRIGREHLKKKNESEAVLWAERMRKAIHVLPPLPTDVKPELRPLLHFLEVMKRVQEEVDAGRVPTVDSRDFAWE
jgi:hypothetical protein